MSKKKLSTDILNPLLGEISRRQGLKKRMTQRQFMIGIKFDPTTWYVWKKSGLSKNAINAIAKTYGVRKEYLETGKGEYFYERIDPTTLNITNQKQFDLYIQQLQREIDLKNQIINSLEDKHSNLKKRLSTICEDGSLDKGQKIKLIESNLELS